MIGAANLLLLGGCEQTLTPEVVPTRSQLVVEGYIEAGEGALPTYVVLTRSLPFFQKIDADGLGDLFVHDARVEITAVGGRSIQLPELCFADLSPAQRQLVAQQLGLSTDSIGFNFCAYVDLLGALPGRPGQKYQLRIRVGNEEVVAETTIPPLVRLDSLRFIPPPGTPNDTLVALRGFISDPPGVANFYRYQTATNDGPLLAPINSVVDDRLFDGRSFEFPLNKAEPRNQRFDPLTFGLYRRGQSVTIKWMAIDQAHFDFWNTLEFNAVNQGPFSNYTRISSNVVGGLGIWGGIAVVQYRLQTPP